MHTGGPPVQQHGWVVFGLIVLGPVAIGLLLDRMGLGRTTSLVGMLAALAATVVLLHETVIRIGVKPEQQGLARIARVTAGFAGPETPIAKRADTTATTAGEPASPRNLIPPLQPASVGASDDGKLGAALAATRADLDAERAAHAKTRDEIASLRALAKSIEAASAKSETLTGTGAVDVSAVLESERAAHDKTRLALKAVEDQVAVLETSRKRLAEELARGEAERAAARKSADEAQGRLVLAEATVSRLEAAVRGAMPRPEPSPLPNPPAPFSAQPQATAAATSSVLRPPESPAAATPDAAAAEDIHRRLASVAPTRQLTLEKISVAELVQSRPGAYYRLACRDAATGKRLVFDGGAYTLTGGDGQLEACIKSVQQRVLGALPAGSVPRLYVQGFASPSGFIKPQSMPPGDTHLKAIDYLPLRREAGQFATSPGRLAVGPAFANKELPLLRGAHVADRIAKATKGALRPEVLEGDVKPGSDEASRSFDLVLHVAW